MGVGKVASASTLYPPVRLSACRLVMGPSLGVLQAQGLISATLSAWLWGQIAAVEATPPHTPPDSQTGRQPDRQLGGPSVLCGAAPSILRSTLPLLYYSTTIQFCSCSCSCLLVSIPARGRCSRGLSTVHLYTIRETEK